MYNMNLTMWTSKEAYHLTHNFGGGPLLTVAIESGERWVSRHMLLHRSIETYIKEHLNEIEAFVQERYTHYDPKEKWQEARAQASLRIPEEHGFSFTVFVTLNSVSIPNEDRQQVCARIVRIIEDNFESSAVID